VAEQTFNRAGGAVVGDVRWFWNRIYGPYISGGEKFEWAQGGNNAFIDILELRSGSSEHFSANLFGLVSGYTAVRTFPRLRR
jgi:hypothetical protein